MNPLVRQPLGILWMEATQDLLISFVSNVLQQFFGVPYTVTDKEMVYLSLPEDEQKP